MSDARQDALADAALNLGRRIGRVIPMVTQRCPSQPMVTRDVPFPDYMQIPETIRRDVFENRPVVAEWPHGASLNPDMSSIEWRDATNVAVLLGPEEGLFVLCAGARGSASIAELEGKHVLPSTVSVLKFNCNHVTSCVYYFFRWPEPPQTAYEMQLPCPLGRSRVTFRGERQWMTCPPGTRSTVWMPGHGPGEVEIAVAPEWLLELCARESGQI